MPKSEGHKSARVRVTRQQEPKRKSKSVESSVPISSPGLEGLQSANGGDFSDATFERHAAMLGDDRLSHPMYAQQRAAFVQQIQRDYGNGYVQRLAAHIQASKVSAQREAYSNNDEARNSREAHHSEVAELQRASDGQAARVNGTANAGTIQRQTIPEKVDAIVQAGLNNSSDSIKVLELLKRAKDADIKTAVANMTKPQFTALLDNLDKYKAPDYKDVLTKVKGIRVVATGESMVGELEWRGGSGPDEYDDYQVDEETSWGHQNDFAMWIRGNGPEPSAANPTMNCWEGVLFMAYKAGVIKKNWLVDLHNAAAKKGKAADDPAAYYTELQNRLNYKSSKEVPYHKVLNRRVPSTTDGNIPAGSIVFIEGLAHVVLAKGEKDANENQKVLSLWLLPPQLAIGAALDANIHFGPIQDVTLESVSQPTEKVEYAPAPW